MSQLLKDHTEARGRTMLSWQRTSLGFVAMSALTIKLAGLSNNWIAILSAVIALIGAAILYIISEKRKYGHSSPYLSLIISASVVILLGFVCLVSFI